MKLDRIQEKISQLRELKKWEVLAWLEIMMEKIQAIDGTNEKKSIEIIEKMVDRLPLVLILAMEGGIICNRCAIISVLPCNKQARRISEGIPTRHPLEKDFSLTPLLESLIAGKEERIYISDPRTNELTKEQKDLVEKAGINAIYFVKANTLIGNIVIAVDATGTKKEFSLEEREFLDTISRFLGKIETEKEKLKMNLEQVARETKINTIGYFTAAIIHLLRNRMVTIGGLCRRIGMEVKNGNGVDGIVQKSNVINRQVTETERILMSLSELSHNLSKLGVLHLHACPIKSIVDFLFNFSQQEEITINDQCHDARGERFNTDQRKLVKALLAVIKKLKRNELPIVISLKQTEKNFSVMINQKSGNFQSLESMHSLAKSYEIEALSVLSPDDLNLSAYLVVLPQISDSFEIKNDSLTITFNLRC